MYTHNIAKALKNNCSMQEQPLAVKKENPLPHQKNKNRILLNFWKRLVNITQLSFQAKTNSEKEGGWDGKGQGEVIITKENIHTFIFHEKGTWQNKQGEKFNFSNTFRWTLDRNAGVISLEHLRRGPKHPVFLFHLTPSGTHSLVSLDAHLCGKDTYFGQIYFNRDHLHLNWKVIGPQKNEELDYFYS